VEIVNSTTDTTAGPQSEVVRFQVRAVFKGPGDVTAAAAAAPASKAPPAAQLKPKG